MAASPASAASRLQQELKETNAPALLFGGLERSDK
jgi:hypothetical protein